MVKILHEQDGGINWRHMAHGTLRPGMTRARNLVLLTILTVGYSQNILLSTSYRR